MGKYHCTAGLQLVWLGFSFSVHKNNKLFSCLVKSILVNLPRVQVYSDPSTYDECSMLNHFISFSMIIAERQKSNNNKSLRTVDCNVVVDIVVVVVVVSLLNERESVVSLGYARCVASVPRRLIKYPGCETQLLHVSSSSSSSSAAAAACLLCQYSALDA